MKVHTCNNINEAYYATHNATTSDALQWFLCGPSTYSPYFPENHLSQSEIHVCVDRHHKACELIILIQLQT